MGGNVKKIANGINCGCHWMNYCVERISAALLFGMLLLVWLNIISRYLFTDLNITWAEELSRYFMIWCVLLAISCGVYRSEHINFQIILSLLHAKLQKVICFFLYFISLAFFVVLFWFGLTFLEEGSFSYASIFGMTMYYPNLSVPVFSFISIIYVISGFISFIAFSGDDSHNAYKHKNMETT